jgi:hypothetical protein
MVLHAAILFSACNTMLGWLVVQHVANAKANNIHVAHDYLRHSHNDFWCPSATSNIHARWCVRLALTTLLLFWAAALCGWLNHILLLWAGEK